MFISTTLTLTVELVTIHTKFRGIFEDLILMDMIEDQEIVTVESASLIYREGKTSNIVYTLHNNHVTQPEADAFERYVLDKLEEQKFLAMSFIAYKVEQVVEINSN